MADETDEPLGEIEFIPARADADIRLQCFQQVSGRGDFKTQLECAKRLYDWVMEFGSDEGPEEPAATTSEEECERRH